VVLLQAGQGWLAYIKWKGYSEDYNSWERVTAIPLRVVDRYRREHPYEAFCNEPWPPAPKAKPKAMECTGSNSSGGGGGGGGNSSSTNGTSPQVTAA